MANTYRTVAQKRPRGSVTTLFAMLVPDLVPVEGYVSVATTSFNPIDLFSPDVHRKYDGECCGGAGNDPSWRFLLPRRVQGEIG